MRKPPPRYPASMTVDDRERDPARPSLEAGLSALRREDREAITGLEVVQAHRNESHWWNHASFALPLLGFAGFVALGLFTGSAEATGFGVFLGIVLVVQLPIVYFTWRRSATAVVLTRAGALALHGGRVLQEVRWSELARIERVETFGNVRWKLSERDEAHLAVEGEIEDVRGLVERASELSGIEPSDPVR